MYGRYLEVGTNQRTGGVRIEPGGSRPAIGLASGGAKVPAIIGALLSRILKGLITDEPTARAILECAG